MEQFERHSQLPKSEVNSSHEENLVIKHKQHSKGKTMLRMSQRKPAFTGNKNMIGIGGLLSPAMEREYRYEEVKGNKLDFSRPSLSDRVMMKPGGHSEPKLNDLLYDEDKHGFDDELKKNELPLGDRKSKHID